MKRLSLAMMGLAIAGLMTMVSCRKPNVNNFNTTGEKITFSATTENNSKTYAEEGLDGDMYVKWEKGDEISINGNVFTLEGEGGETSGSFTGNVAEAEGYFASYSATNDGSSVTFNVPAKQDNGTNLDEKIPMVAYTTEKGDNLEFKNMVNILQLNLTGTQTINEIEVSSTAENLSGSFTVGTDRVPNYITSGTKKITVTKSLNLSDGQKTVYVVLPVFSSAESMVTVKFTGDEGEMTGSFRLKGSESASYATTPNHRYTMDVAVSLVEPVETDEWINFNDATMDVSGLPKWAKKNIGATCSTENTKDPNTAATWYGDYYAWGATTTWYEDGTASSPTWKSGYSDGYSWAYCPYTNGTYSSSNKAVFIKYVPQDKAKRYGYDGYYDVKTVLDLSDPCDDAARAVLGGSWRMPTGSEWKQLKDNTLFVWTDNYKGISNLNGYVVYKVKATAHKGQKATSSGNGDYNYSGIAYALTDPHMFLPAAGRFKETSLDNAGSYGYYWSSSLYSDDPTNALYMNFYSASVTPQHRSLRYNGFAVRPVQ